MLRVTVDLQTVVNRPWHVFFKMLIYLFLALAATCRIFVVVCRLLYSCGVRA